MSALRGPVLFIGREDSGVLAHLRDVALELLELGPSEPLTPAYLTEHAPGFVVSHGYRIILKGDVLQPMTDRVVNLHISLLPWNRGADPVLWSVLEGTPAGATIHYMDEGVDTGDLIAQRRVDLLPSDTFATAYDKCTDALVALFQEQWPAIEAGTCERHPQPEGGSSHRVADRAGVEHLLTDGWDTPIGPLMGRLRA